MKFINSCPVPDYNDDERMLAALEQSWADYSRALRTGYRVRVLDTSTRYRAGSLVQVASEFDRLKAEYQAGRQSAVMFAIQFAAEENVPLPYWVADAIQDAMTEVFEHDKSLHTAFGFDAIYPARGKRASKARQDGKTKVALYIAASLLIAQGVGKKTAINRAIKENNLPVRSRKAWDWYGEMDQRQQAAIKAWNIYKKVHKLR